MQARAPAARRVYLGTATHCTSTQVAPAKASLKWSALLFRVRHATAPHHPSVCCACFRRYTCSCLAGFDLDDANDSDCMLEQALNLDKSYDSLFNGNGEVLKSLPQSIFGQVKYDEAVKDVWQPEKSLPVVFVQYTGPKPGDQPHWELRYAAARVQGQFHCGR